MYKTGQPIRYDARDHLLWLASLPEFQMVRNPPSEIEQRAALPLHASYGWHHVPANVSNAPRLVERPLGTVRTKVAGVLPPTMRSLAEMLCLLGSNKLTGFCERIEIKGSRPLRDQRQIARLQNATWRRLEGSPAASDRKTISRLLKAIDPAICRPPIDHLDPALVVGQPIAFSASALYFGGSVVGVPSAAGWPVLGYLGPTRVELSEPPTTIGWRIRGGAIDGSASAGDRSIH